MVSLGRVELPCVPVYWLLRSRVILRSFCLVYLWKNSSGSLLIFHCSVVWVRSHWALDICFEKLPNQVTAFALTASKLDLRKLAPTLPLRIKLQHLKTVTYKQQFLNQYLNSVYSLWEICLCWASGNRSVGSPSCYDCGQPFITFIWQACFVLMGFHIFPKHARSISWIHVHRHNMQTGGIGHWTNPTFKGQPAQPPKLLLPLKHV